MNIFKIMNSQFFSDPGVIELDSESSNSSNSFILKFTSSESESEELELAVSVSSTTSEEIDVINCTSTNQVFATVDTSIDRYFETENEDRSISPIFDFKMSKCKRETVSCESLDFNNYNIEAYMKKTLFSNNFEDNVKENSSSEESELELEKLKKIKWTTNKELFSSDDSILSEEGNKYYLRPRKLERRRTTRSQTLQMQRLMQRQVMEIFKEKRSQAIKSEIKSLIPSIDTRSVQSGTSLRISFGKKLREMTLFRIV